MAPLVQQDFSVVLNARIDGPVGPLRLSRELWKPRRPLLWELAVCREPESRLARSARYLRIPAALSRRAVAARTGALNGVDGAGVGTKARTLKFKSSESGPRIIC